MACTCGIKRKTLSIFDKLMILKKIDEVCRVKKQKKIVDELGISSFPFIFIIK